ncbi:MAG: hypothetical protein A3J08_03730 [Candidatus Lloydbacteria bacterium RIFCSPLOWO2_02_FULL_51_11]|uniref:Uncharacterized protein n=2 Tax=Candidatus Lloydiibacteriota TaxID=1817910 RepID=A0A1G2DKX8_9BACT|nr:MAG: hypothetical protein A3J08_03730 [Candidatus Lloydbacteria bacterium RIFCSPLOWO2_02_FULL_51_11]
MFLLVIGMYLKVIVNSGAKKEKIEEGPASTKGSGGAKKKGELKISVREPAQRNLANTRVRELLAARFKVPLSAVRILAGHRSPRKLFSIDTSSHT